MEHIQLPLRELRRARKLTQARVAQEIGISYPAYRRYESGQRDIPLSVAIRLADLFQVSLDKLAGR